MEREEARRRLVQQLLQSGGQMGMNVASDPLAYAGGASVVPPLYSQYNPAGAYAEAGRTVPNYISDDARAMNQVSLPQGGDPSDLHGWDWNNPYGRSGAGYPGMGVENMGFPHGITAQGAVDPSTGQMRVVPPDTSVVAPPRMPTEKETLDREVMGPANERDAAFSRLHALWAQGHPFFSLDPDDTRQGYDTEGVGELPEFTEIYLQVPDEVKKYAHDNPTDAILQQFEEKYGFPLDVSIEIP